MADAGFSADKKFVDKYLHENKYVPIQPDDNPIVIEIKNNINDVIKNDKLIPKSYNNHKYYYHTAWENKYGKLLIKINQLRVKNWFWDKLK